MKDGSFVFLFRDDSRKEIFLVYRSDWPIWNIPGGGIEKGETPREAALREAYEETGLKVNILQQVGKKTRVKANGNIKTVHYFEGRIISGSFVPEFPECKGKWFKVDHLPTDLLDVNRESILLGAKYNGTEFNQKPSGKYCFRDLIILFRHPFAGIKFLRRKGTK